MNVDEVLLLEKNKDLAFNSFAVIPLYYPLAQQSGEGI